MKKILIFLFCGIFILISNGCSGGGRVTDLSEEMKGLGIAAVETTDDFLDGNITGDEAIERLENNYSSANQHYEKELEEAGSDTLVGTDYWKDSTVPTYILSLKMSVGEKNKGTGTSEEVIEDRNKLAEIIGKKER